MIWMAWRQHRAAALACGLLLAALAAVFVPQSLSMHAALDSRGLGHCLQAPGPDCSAGFAGFPGIGAVGQLTGWLVLVPLMMGVMLGAPMIARELESGTYQVAWTQATTRTRWIMVKLGLLGLGVVTASGAFAALVTWWRQPVDSLSTNDSNGRFGSFIFSIEGTVVVGYSLFAFFLGVLAGAMLRRTVLAMVVTSGIFVATLLGTQFFLRPHYLSPVTTLTALPTGNVPLDPGTTGTPGDWLLDYGIVDSGGHRLSQTQIHDAMQAGFDARVPAGDWFDQQHLRHLLVYQPVSRFWTFQWIETGIFVALSAVLAGILVWYVHRRLP
jgi:ABC-2 family transporter protein